MVKKKIGIIGYGALGRQIEHFIKETEAGDALDIYYFDDILFNQGYDKAYPFKDFADNRFKDFEFYIGLGYNHLSLRNEICDQLITNAFSLPSFIHKTAYINPAAKIGQGVFIYPMSNIDQYVSIENGVIINNSVTISHDTFIGECTFISPGVTIAGNVKIGKYCFLGTGSLIANNIELGYNVKAGIGTIITRDVPADSYVIGNPFKILEQGFKLL